MTEASSIRILPFILKAFKTSPKKVCFCFFPADEICKPFDSSIEISKSPHRVKRLDTNDPNGSTVAPVPKVKYNFKYLNFLINELKSAYIYKIQEPKSSYDMTPYRAENFMVSHLNPSVSTSVVLKVNNKIKCWKSCHA